MFESFFKALRVGSFSILFLIFSSFGACYADSGIGINLNFPERGGTFIDLVKENYRWSINNRPAGRQQVDDKGWPTMDADYVVDYRPVAEWSGEIDDPGSYRPDMSGAWKAMFTGQAKLTLQMSGQIEGLEYHEQTNTTTFDLIFEDTKPRNTPFFILQFRDTRRTVDSQPNSGITNFRLHRPGYPLERRENFTDEFINALTGIEFEAIRFMEFTGANEIEPQWPQTLDWSQRKLTSDASQSRLTIPGKNGNASWDYVIELANLVKKDIWINVPLAANANYIQMLASLLEDELDPDLKVYVESSNEVWNSQFSQHKYNVAQASSLGLGEHQNHARRTVEIANIFKNTFGEGSLTTRIRPILASHSPMLKWWVEPMLQYIDDEHGTPSELIYGISSQGYMRIPRQEGQSIESILEITRNNMENQFDESGKVNESGRMQWVAAARRWSLKGGYFQYEAGTHPEQLGSTVNLANIITAERHPEMANLIIENYSKGFLDLGGTMTMHFLLTSAYSRFGSFGLTDDVNNPERNEKYQALRDLAKKQTR